jgi:hypothetical protein
VTRAARWEGTAGRCLITAICCVAVGPGCGGKTSSGASGEGIVAAGGSSGSVASEPSASGGGDTVVGTAGGPAFTGSGGARAHGASGGAQGVIDAGSVRPPSGPDGGSSPSDAGTRCAWRSPATMPTGSCGSWWGGTFAGATGAATCPCPNSPQFLAYGITDYPPYTTVLGPFGSKMEGEILSCSYNWEYPGTPATPPNIDWLKIPYFGGGTSKLSAPTGTVTAARAACSTPTGTEVTPSSYAEQAKQIIGTWVVCLTSPVQPPSPTAGSLFAYDGISVQPDGSFQALRADPTDHLVPVQACNSSGLWGLDTAQFIQLDIFMDGGEIIGLLTDYAGPPGRVRLDNNGQIVSLVLVE